MIHKTLLTSIILLMSFALVGSRADVEYKVWLPAVQAPPRTFWYGVGMPYKTCAQLAELQPHAFFGKPLAPPSETGLEWSAQPPDCSEEGYHGEAIPTIWSGPMVGRPIGGNSDTLIWYTLPANENQANTPPILGAELYVLGVTTYYSNVVYHTTPVIDEHSMWWLDDWWAECDRLTNGNCPADILAYQCYWGYWPEAAANHCMSVTNMMADWATAHGISRMWLMETTYLTCWNPPPEGLEEPKQYMDLLYPQLVAHPMVERAFWFSLASDGTEDWNWPCRTDLAYLGGGLTPYGEHYRSLYKRVDNPLLSVVQ